VCRRGGTRAQTVTPDGTATDDSDQRVVRARSRSAWASSSRSRSIQADSSACSPRCSDEPPAAGREPGSPGHGRNRRPRTRRASRSRLARKQGPPAVSADAIVTAPGRSGTGAWRSARCALWVNLDAMTVKAWPGWASPAGTTRPPSGSSARPRVLMWPSMPGTPWNWRPGTATGSSYPAPATAASSPAAATAPGSSASRGGRPGSGERRAGPRRR